MPDGDVRKRIALFRDCKNSLIEQSFEGQAECLHADLRVFAPLAVHQGMAVVAEMRTEPVVGFLPYAGGHAVKRTGKMRENRRASGVPT